ncbi:uncharacterized protein METZ01_LOCUS104029 [marine metagenome]|uniref:Uncharacterized protein n=1 Tax=marine metagenome TaxID=408172 RepID=A0A381WFC8_9ZZZZ
MIQCDVLFDLVDRETSKRHSGWFHVRMSPSTRLDDADRAQELGALTRQRC